MTSTITEAAAPVDVAEVLRRTGWDARLRLTDDDRARMRRSRARLTELAGSAPVYGLSSGFGPLVEFPGDTDPSRQATGLINHLATGQGTPLPPEVVRTMIWLRLNGMRLGHSAVDPDLWDVLADQWNSGFTPLVPSDGSLSASGDLVPLAHAALAAADSGVGELGLAPVSWDARSALAFVNGTSASLARALHNHVRLAALARAAATATARIATLLGCNTEPYSEAIAAVRGHRGHREAAGWIRAELGGAPDPARPLQEPYSLRCAPQVIGAVLDQLRLQGEVLVVEATGCTDNPVLVDDDIWHGGNFHAAPVALASEQHAVCLHQVAFLAERQLALLVDPHRNGGLTPFLTPEPGPRSGLAGVQIAATSHLGAIRQRCLPASTTAVPSNLGNQDHVPLALNSANLVADMLDRAWWITGSLFLAVNQLGHVRGGPEPTSVWARLRAEVPVVDRDRPLHQDVLIAARIAEQHSTSVRTT